jgi:TetR/AcrR family fatty acid metabolism transcriptional regulator
MATARDAGRPDKRRQILDAAIEVFADKGFFGAKVSDIARAAGVADGTIYLYFKRKDDVLAELFRDQMAVMNARLSALVDGDEDPATKIRSYVEGHLELVAERPKLMHVLTVELRQSARFMTEQPAHLAFGRYLALLAQVVEEGQRQGVFHEDLTPATISRALFGAIDEIARSWVLGGVGRTPFDRRQAARQLGDFCLRGLLRGA